jgi:glycosyltransferase involved in cell wall biosynthesis
MKPLVSIIMPVKNAMPFLIASIESVLEQQLDDWELIAVNDSSHDDSLKTLRNYQKNDSRITVLQNRGTGIIPALQTGYSHSRGTYIHRMDADDLMVPQKLQILNSMLKKHGKGYVATAHVRYFSEKGVGDGYKKYENWLNTLCKENKHWKELYKECVIASPCWMVHREDFEKCGAFNATMYPEDYDLVFRFYKNGLDVISSPEVLHLWRDHQGRTSRNHEHYQQNAFFKIKLHYFFQLHRDSNRPLVVWGAGTKGKIMAKLLNERNENYTWVSNNPKKNGKEIYQQVLQDYRTIITKNKPQVIVTVAQRNSQKEIISFLQENGLLESNDYYLFR